MGHERPIGFYLSRQLLPMQKASQRRPSRTSKFFKTYALRHHNGVDNVYYTVRLVHIVSRNISNVSFFIL